MKNKSGLCLVLLLSFFLTSYAGDSTSVKYTWGDFLKLPKKHRRPLYFKIDNTWVAASSNSESIWTQKLSADLKPGEEKLITVSGIPKPYESEGLYTINHKNYWLYTAWNSGEKREHLFARELDMLNGTFKSDAMELTTSVEQYSTGKSYSFGYSVTDWDLEMSADQSKTLAYHSLLEPSRGKPTHVYLNVFEGDFKKLWFKEIELPYAQNMMDVISYQVDKTGNVYLLIKVIYGEDYRFEIIEYTKDSEEPTTYVISFSGKYALSTTLIEDTTGRMVCAGYYTGYIHKSSAKGAFIMSLDHTSAKLKPIYKGFYDFPEQLLAAFENEKQKHHMDPKPYEGHDKEIASLRIRHLTIGDDGSLTVFGEHMLVESFTYDRNDGRPNSTSYTREVYYNLDIYGMCIGSDGQIRWAAQIPKHQVYSASPTGFGYYVHPVGRDNYLFFIDESHYLVYAKVNNDGTFKVTRLYDMKDDGVKIEPAMFKEISANELILGGVNSAIPLLITLK